MKELVVVSGKGGTGKTSITAAFAAVAASKVMADCDVDAADLHLVLEPKTVYQESFSGGNKARILTDRCIACGRCVDVCRFRAISYSGGAGSSPKPWIDPVFCEGCRVCARVCPVDAVVLEEAASGHWFYSNTPYGPLVHAQLGVAQGNSGKLVSLVRREARTIAERRKHDLIIVDGPPGAGCPVIASITGVDMILAVTEPTLSGRHDLMRLVRLAKHFRVPATLCVNKWDIHPALTEQIEKEALSLGVVPLGRVRYDSLMTQAQVRRTNILSYGQSNAGDDIIALWRRISHVLNGKET